MVELIPTIVNKFRLHKFGITADIEKAFLQIGLQEKDRPFLRFLWWENGDKEENSKINEIPVTKRKILSAVHRIFDPIGFTCPVTLEPKILLQECWKLGVSWDTELPLSISRKFERWKEHLKCLNNLEILDAYLRNFPLTVIYHCMYFAMQGTRNTSIDQPRRLKHIPGILNPADLPSRGCGVVELIASLWWEGPSWLNKPREEWPLSEACPDRAIIDSERKRTVASTIEPKEMDYLSEISSFKKIIRVTAWIYRFYHNLRKQRNDRDFGELITQETDAAERKWTRRVAEGYRTGLLWSQVRPPLPEDRVRKHRFFEITGVDLCGPTFLRDRVETKSWIVLFTCAVFRAVHMELVTSLSTESFILALRRFISRRGRPFTIYSDNGKNLVGTSNELKNIDWKKKSPRKSLPNLRRTLYTVVCDSENVINSRPLTYLSEDQEDLVALTPAMFLQEIKENGVPDLDLIDSQRINRRFLYRQRIRQELRKRFRLEYLGQLKSFSKSRKEDVIKEGDIVLIEDTNSKRIYWPLAKVIKLIPGRDGRVRVVEVSTSSGSFLRPIQRLYPLEVSGTDIPDLPEQIKETLKDRV
ncbi:integrase catalytic domain-containing protein [Trichonephila clavipes]|nr:integrase catalytic domain-containing protein [Trichonephila clavipes]